MTSESSAHPEITVFGAEWCGDCRRTSRLLAELNVAHTYIDVDADESARARAIEIAGRQNIPVVLFSDGAILVEPSNIDLQDALTQRGLIPS